MLFLVDRYVAQDRRGLKSQGLTHVLQAMGGMKPIYPQHVEYKQLEIRDIPQENLSVYFNSVNSWMASAIRRGGKVFVHW